MTPLELFSARVPNFFCWAGPIADLGTLVAADVTLRPW